MAATAEGPLTLTPRFEAALAYACMVHGGQVRKGTPVPYISHLLAVASLVLEHGGDEDQTIAALLHDAVEDAGGPARARDIQVRFGERVARIVDDCSDTDETPKPPWRARKEAYHEHMLTASEDALLVSLADKVHNARAILLDYRRMGSELWNRFSAPNGRADVEWYYVELSGIFLERCPGPLAEELARVVAALHALP